MTDATKPKKKKAHRSSRLMRIFRIIPAVFSFISHMMSLIKAEFLQVRRQLVILILLTLFLLVLMFSVWLSLNIMLYLYLITLVSTVLCAVSLIALGNFILFAIVCCIISTLKVSTTFPETRKVINNLLSY